MNADSFYQKVRKANAIYRPLLFLIGLIGFIASQSFCIPHPVLYAFAIVIAFVEGIALVHSSLL